MPEVNSRKERYCYFIVFLLIYLEWGYAPVVAQNISGIMKTALMIGGVLPLCFFDSFKIDNKSLVLFAYLGISISLRSIGDVEIGNSIMFIVSIFCAFILTSAYAAKDVLVAFCNIMTFLAGYSLICYIVAVVMPSVISLFPLLPNVNGTLIYNLGLSVMPSGVDMIRNYGITWEPGAFALLLCIAIFCQIVGYKTMNKRKVIINILAVITTFSTMGYIVLAAIILITRFKTGAVTKSRVSNMRLLLFVGISIVILLRNSEAYELVFGKLAGISFMEENITTTQARIDAIIYPGAAFLASPVVGVGYDMFKNINETLCNNVATNTIVNWFAILGIVLGIPCTYYYFKAILRASKYLQLNLLFKIVLVGAFALLISTESLLRISLIYVFIFYGCSSKHLIKYA